MRLLALTAAACIVALPAAAQSPGAGAPDAGRIREVVRKYVDAREKRDAKALAALFTEDADQLTTAGEWRKGRNDVVQGGLASSQANPGSRQITIETVRSLGPGVAIADGLYEIGGAPGAAPRRMRTTFVLVRAGDQWRIAAIRNMAPTSPAAR